MTATHQLAQFNVARLHQPLDHPATAAFVDALVPINELAEASPGFVWRLTGEGGASSSYVAIPGVDDPLLIINFSVWQDVESLRAFVYRSDHTTYLRRRREWFETMAEAYLVCWWVPAGTIPSVAEAYRRLVHLRGHGPSDEAWPINRPVEPPD